VVGVFVVCLQIDSVYSVATLQLGFFSGLMSLILVNPWTDYKSGLFLATRVRKFYTAYTGVVETNSISFLG